MVSSRHQVDVAEGVVNITVDVFCCLAAFCVRFLHEKEVETIKPSKSTDLYTAAHFPTHWDSHPKLINQRFGRPLFVCRCILLVLYLSVSISERFANWLINNWQIMISIKESRTRRDICVVFLEWRSLNLKTTNVLARKAFGQTQRLKINQRT